MAVPMTLAEARTTVAQHLDDPNNRRWSTTQIDFALSSALSRCQSDYCSAGGDRFDAQTTGTTSASDGTLSLSSVSPLLFRSVCVEVDDVHHPITAVTKRDKVRPDTTARDLVIIYVREYVLPTTTSHALVGVGATAANTWAAFDHWIVARAAAQLAVKDDKLSPAITTLSNDCEASVMNRVRLPQAVAWPRAGMTPASYAGLRWTWLPSSTQLQLCTSGGGYW